MSKIAVIGAAYLSNLPGLNLNERQGMDTPYGELASPLLHATLAEKKLILLSRHGEGYTIPTHRVNYRANIWALKELGVSKIIGVLSVGGIRPDMTPGHFSIPDQLIDYTHSRDATFFDTCQNSVHYLDFSYPFSQAMRQIFILNAEALGLNYSDSTTYGVSQGPRSQTVAEINRMEKDGCDLVGMSGMPEIVLARELGMEYVAIAVVTNKAAGRSEGLPKVTRESMSHVLYDSREALFDLLSAGIAELE